MSTLRLITGKRGPCGSALVILNAHDHLLLAMNLHVLHALGLAEFGDQVEGGRAFAKACAISDFEGGALLGRGYGQDFKLVQVFS